MPNDSGSETSYDLRSPEVTGLSVSLTASVPEVPSALQERTRHTEEEAPASLEISIVQVGDTAPTSSVVASTEQEYIPSYDPSLLISEEDVKICLEAAATARQGEERQAREAGRLWESLFDDEDDAG